MTDCNHKWIANSGNGGPPEFKPNRTMGCEPLVHVQCEACGARTWMTEEQWDAATKNTGAIGDEYVEYVRAQPSTPAVGLTEFERLVLKFIALNLDSLNGPLQERRLNDEVRALLASSGQQREVADADRADVIRAHDVLQSVRSMVSDNDEAWIDIGLAMTGLQAVLARAASDSGGQ
jgi:hypothetical protein